MCLSRGFFIERLFAAPSEIDPGGAPRLGRPTVPRLGRTYSGRLAVGFYF